MEKIVKNACEIEIHFMAASVGGRHVRNFRCSWDSFENWRDVSNNQPNDRIKWKIFS